jgi:predicted protein tyrosine phosphatase
MWGAHERPDRRPRHRQTVRRAAVRTVESDDRDTERGVGPVGVDQLSEQVWLGSSGETHTMVARGVGHLVDLRAEATPAAMTTPVDHIPIEDLARDQDDPIMQAARRVKELADSGVIVGVYCQAGVSRTAAVAIAYLMLEGMNLDDATARLRACRPNALPALGLWRSLEAIEGRLLDGR